MTRGKLIRGLVWLKYRLLGRYHPYNPDGAVPPKISYSQAGEDCIVSAAMHFLGIPKPSYLDTGAYHPTSLSNTHFFYRRGDVFLNAAVGTRPQTEADAWA